MDTCPVCGAPCLGWICTGCLDEMSSVEECVIKKFIYALASREGKTSIKDEKIEELDEYQEG